MRMDESSRSRYLPASVERLMPSFRFPGHDLSGHILPIARYRAY